MLVVTLHRHMTSYVLSFQDEPSFIPRILTVPLELDQRAYIVSMVLVCYYPYLMSAPCHLCLEEGGRH